MFGALGIGCVCLGGVSFAATAMMKLGADVDMTGNPLLLLTAFAWLAALQFFSLGLLGEVSARIYYASQPRQRYAIRALVNFDDGRPAIAA